MKKAFWLLIVFLISHTAGMAFGEGKIAYSCFDGKNWQIGVYETSTKTIVQVTLTPYDKRSPAWSPDGKKIVYRSGNGELFVLDVATKKEEKILSKIHYLVDPQWISVDELLVTRYRTDVTDDSDIWLVNIKTGDKKVLVSGPGLQFQPFMSPDGKKLLYVSSTDPDHDHIYMKDLKAGKTERLTQGNAFNFLPSFAPSGMQVAFASDQSGDNEVYQLDLKDKSLKQLTKSPGMDACPRWINNTELIYMSFKEGRFQINSLNAETLQTETLIRGETDCVDPDWTAK